MSENKGPNPQEHARDHNGFAVSLTTRPIRAVGQRRRDAEEKLAHHLEQVRHRDEPHEDRHALNKDGGGLPV